MRILVVDDHPLFRDGLVSLLEASGHVVVGQADGGKEAVVAAICLEPDVVLMDIAMPQFDGMDALCRIKAEAPQVKVVMLTASEDDASLITAIRSGAQGYLLKSLSAEEVLSSLDRLTRGELAISNQDINRMVEGLIGLVNQPTDHPKDMLTSREAELLQLVANGFSNKAIGQHLSVSENTVKYHMRQILLKLDAQNRTEAAILAIQSGLIKKDDPS